MRVKGFQAGMFGNNTFVVWCEETGFGLVVDPAAGASAALLFIRSRNLRIETIVYTHAHPDHVSGARLLKQATGARVLAHTAASEMMRSPLFRLACGFGLFFKPVPPDAYISDGDTIKAGQVSLIALHTPGHTPDSLCLSGEGAVFTGDLIISGSVGRTDLPGGSLAQLQRSIAEKILPLGDDTRIYPGHGPESTLREEKRVNPFVHTGLRTEG
jgi:hydroxyacylglutathione hydrolase